MSNKTNSTKKKIRLEPSYVTEDRQELAKFISDNSRKTKSELDKLSYNKLREMSNKIKSTQSELSMRKEQRRELRRQYKSAQTSFLQNPSLRNQEEAISSRVSYVTGLPADVSDIISQYASDPLISTKKTPEGRRRKPRAINALKKIIESGGAEFDLRDFDRVENEKGQIVTKSAQASDFVVKKLIDQYADDIDNLKALLGDPDMPDDAPRIREIMALRDSLESKKTVTGVRGRQKEEEKEKEVRDVKEAVRVSTMAEGYEFEEEEEKAQTPVTAEMGTQMAPVTSDVYTMYRPRVSSAGTQTKSATEFRRDVERDIRKSMRKKFTQREATEERRLREAQVRFEGIEDVTPSRVTYKPKAERTIMDKLFRPIGETQDDRDVSSLMDWMVDEVVGRETEEKAEEKYGGDDLYADELEDDDESDFIRAVTASNNMGFTRDKVFRDNSIREINAGLTGLEQNSSIPLTGKVRPTIRQTADIPEEKEYYANDDYEDRELQNDELEGPADEWIHGDPNDNSSAQNVNSLLLAENNQYTEAQKAILRRGQANRQIQNRLRKSNLDAVLGQGDVPLGERDDEEKYEEEDDDEQGGIGGGLGDFGFDEDPEVVEGGDRERQTIQNEIERQLIKPRTKWVGDRGVTADFQRVAIADRIGDSLKNSQSLNAMRKTPIPWKRPSRTYANNYVGLIRNSTRSMILQTNLLEP